MDLAPGDRGIGWFVPEFRGVVGCWKLLGIPFSSVAQGFDDLCCDDFVPVWRASVTVSQMVLGSDGRVAWAAASVGDGVHSFAVVVDGGEAECLAVCESGLHGCDAVPLADTEAHQVKEVADVQGFCRQLDRGRKGRKGRLEAG